MGAKKLWVQKKYLVETNFYEEKKFMTFMTFTDGLTCYTMMMYIDPYGSNKLKIPRN